MLSTYALDTQVLKKDLCTSCGACQGMCPYWGSWNGRTVWLFDCDRKDGRCQAFCPRMPYDREALRSRFFDAADVDPDIGPCKGLYLVRSADPADRDGAQHGGTVTALLKLALAEGMIDAAVLNHMNGEDPEGFLATSAEDVMACRGSSFRIAPTLAKLNEALKADEYKKIAVVGTACKTLATYKMLAKPYPDRDNNADNIGLVIGLFCGWGLDWDGLKELAAKYVPLEEIAHMDIPPSKYHSLVIRAKDGREVSPGSERRPGRGDPAGAARLQGLRRHDRGIRGYLRGKRSFRRRLGCGQGLERAYRAFRKRREASAAGPGEGHSGV